MARYRAPLVRWDAARFLWALPAPSGAVAAPSGAVAAQSGAVAAQSEGARQLPEVRREEPLLAAWDEVPAEPREARASVEELLPARASAERAERAAARRAASADQMPLHRERPMALELVAPMEIQGGAAEKPDASVPHQRLAVLPLAQLDEAVQSKAAAALAAARPE